jgi:hypothetical protein
MACGGWSHLGAIAAKLRHYMQVRPPVTMRLTLEASLTRDSHPIVDDEERAKDRG